ncbi:acyl-[acyl-carrier-protein]--UDP-N-acetylglucosamine O-acyltransferase [Chromatiales bacterium (ex Bugula neritina AB1)]|nr:acyl-[acyl-carrier-protein]--UDP-N-acetylglucosamine O-acyltransferase [Chromatiales bacterium (ex Bugula neritina AB1)]
MIHRSAVIDAEARVHESCEIGPFCVVGADVEIGAGTVVGPHVVINGPTIIGEQNRIFQFASIGEDPQDLKFDGEQSRLEIGDRNKIREFVTINRGTTGGGGVTRIGNDNLLMSYVHIAHDCLVGNNTVFANSASLAGHVEVGDYAILGGFSLIHQFSRIGAHSFSGMGSVINKDVPPFVLVSGHYAEAVGINKEGLKRRGFSSEEISALRKVFVELVKRRGVKSDEVYAQIDAMAQEYPRVLEFVEFIKKGKRGTV